MKISQARWFPIALILVVLGGLLAAGQWARIQNEARDDGIAWVWAYSPRTMQSYLVRATPEPEISGLSFRLEGGSPYVFRGCQLAKGDEDRSCLDQNQAPWNLTLD